MTTAVYDRLQLDLTELKQLLSITTNEADAYLSLTLKAAKRAADNFLNNPFEELATLDADDYVNWQGNLTGEEGLVQGSDVLTSDFGSARLAHNVPSLHTDPAVTEGIPDDVKFGVVEWCRLFVAQKPADVMRERIGDWQVDYAVFVSKPDRTAFIKETFWRMYRLIPGT